MGAPAGLKLVVARKPGHDTWVKLAEIFFCDMVLEPEMLVQQNQKVLEVCIALRMISNTPRVC